MAFYQVVEKDDYGTDWAPARFGSRALTRFETEEEAEKEAIAYLTDRNCNNALTVDEKRNNIEAFMMTDEGCMLGILDGKSWYLTYPKDILDRDRTVKCAKGTNVMDKAWFELEGKTEVAVRTLPGT